MSERNGLSASAAQLAGKYLTFRLGEEEYGIEILKVREIFGMQRITSVPGVPPYVKGVINLRGWIIPVIDMRLKFGLAKAEYNQETCIIVVAFGDMMIGFIVDMVSEVVDIHERDIEDSPSFGAGTPTEFILGMGKVNERVVLLLNVGAVVSEYDKKPAESISY